MCNVYRCPMIGTHTNAVQPVAGGSGWYCREHFKAIQSGATGTMLSQITESLTDEFKRGRHTRDWRDVLMETRLKRG